MLSALPTVGPSPDLTARPLPWRAYALFTTYGLALFGALGGLPSLPEHELHLFLASHYAQRYFDLYDPRWYGGFLVSGHPPLAHELVALLGKLPLASLERAYAALVVTTCVLLVYAASRFVGAFAGRTSGDDAAMLLSVHPLTYLLLFPYGQLPFLLAAGLSLLAVSVLWEWAGSRTRTPPLGFVALGAAALCAHPLAVLPLGGGATVAIGLCLQGERGARGGGLAVALLGLTLLWGGWATWPFWQETLEGSTRPVRLSKLSPGDANPLAVAALATGFALALWSALRAPRWAERSLPLVAMACLAASLAELPWLSAEKLLWAGMTLALMGLAAVVVRDTPAERVAAGVLLLALFVACAVTLGRPPGAIVRHRRAAVAAVRDVLSRDEHQRYRYLTLGLGSERLELSRRVKAGSLDGGLPWARGADALEGTHHPSLDELPLDVPEAVARLRQVLSEANGRHLRFVVTADERAQPLLEEAGFRLRSAWKGGVVLWSKDDVPPLPAQDRAPVRSLAWSLLPPGFLMAGLLLLVGGRWTR